MKQSSLIIAQIARNLMKSKRKKPEGNESESEGSIQKGIQVAPELFPLDQASVRHTNRLFKARS